MPNYKKLAVNYDRDSILNLLDPVPRDQTISCEIRPCTDIEKYNIAKILNIKIPIKSILYFKLGTNFIGYIHKDSEAGTGDSLYKQEFAVNLPIIGCNDVYMRWYKQIDMTVTAEPFMGPSGKTLTPFLTYDNAICIDNLQCNTANLVAVDDWHAIENLSSNHYGYLISLRFDDTIVQDWWR